MNHFEGGKQAQPASVFRAQPLGIDCDTAPGIVIHDDGTIEDGYSGNPGAGVTEVRVVDKFTPTSYPNSYTSVCLDFVTLAGGPPTYNVDIVVFDDDGPVDHRAHCSAHECPIGDNARIFAGSNADLEQL